MIKQRYIGDRAFYKRMIAVMLPILIQNVITNFVNLLDNIMVGQLGTEPMSGVAIINQLLFVFNLCIYSGLAGAGIFTAQFFGKGDSEGVKHTFRTKMLIAAVIVVIGAVVLTQFDDVLIMQFIHESDAALDLNATFEYGNLYLDIMLVQLIPFALSQIYASTLRETGETVVPMVAGIAAVFVNLIFNYILIFGKFGAPALGVAGAAFATVLARIVEFLIVALWTHCHRKQYTYIQKVYSSPYIPGSLLVSILKVGFPLLVNELLWSGGLVIMNQCYSIRGLEAVSATNITSTVYELFICSFIAMGNTIGIIVGQHLGAGDLDKALDENRKLTAFSVVFCMFIGILMAALAPLIPRIYNTTDNVKQMASAMLIASACLMPFNAYTNACYFTLRSGGKSVITMLFDCGFTWACCIPIAFILSRFTSVSIVPMYAAIQCMDIPKCVIGYVLIKRKTWLNNLVSQ